jgi:HAD superfamily hydrolase (TIGR01490 family)
MKKPALALFDFDGTITSRDTLLEFIYHSKGGLAFYIGFLVLSPLLVAMRLGVIPNWRVKQWVLKLFFYRDSLEEFNKSCREFSRHRLPGLLRRKALDEIREHKRNGHRVVVVTASAENWIRSWADEYQVELLATQLEAENGRLTGNICGRNCHGVEKVERIRKHLTLSDYSSIYAYGDSPGDREMLELGTHSYYKPFR